MRKIFLFAALIFLGKTYSQTNFTANIKDLDFIAGHWTTTYEWGDMEETWSKPTGDNMMCSYRCVKDGKTVFYEFIVIEQTGDVPVMKLHHFGPGNVSWENKQPYVYPLVSLEKNKAVFKKANGSLIMTYNKKGINEMLVTLEEKNKAGKWTKYEFDYLQKDVQ